MKKNVKQVVEKLGMIRKKYMKKNSMENDEVKNQTITEKQFFRGAIVTAMILLCLSAYLIMDSFTVAASAATEAFATSRDETVTAVYDFFYEESYAAAEKSHHVKNDVLVSIGQLSEEQDLEVLIVSEVDYQISSKTNEGWFTEMINSIIGNTEAEVWLEIPGKGVFTVDLSVSEFIIDNERQYVLIRVPSPKMTKFAVVREKVQLFYFADNNIVKHSAKEGVEKVREHIENAAVGMEQRIYENQEYANNAKEHTQAILETFVKQLNPQLPDLVVEVEFWD